jgi:hypothetical protein
MEKMKKKIKEGIYGMRQEVKTRTAGYVATALGLVAGLAWNDAIKSLIEYYLPLSGQNVWAKLIYAAILTIVVVLVSAYLTRLFMKDEEAMESKDEKK